LKGTIIIFREQADKAARGEATAALQLPTAG